MTARDRFTVKLECPMCGKTGVAHLSQADGYSNLHDRSTRVEALAQGFKPVEQRTGPYDLLIYCADCDVKAEK
jgi:hypothetical protein